MIIKNGWIHDAVNREPYQADLLIQDGKIREIGPDLAPAEGDPMQSATKICCVLIDGKPVEM